MASLVGTAHDSLRAAWDAKLLRHPLAPRALARSGSRLWDQKPRKAGVSLLLCAGAASCWFRWHAHGSRSGGVKRCVTAERTARREELMRPKTAASNKWHWKDNITVHYAKAASKIPGTDTAVVLLHGFGVASFHYEAQFGPLSEAGYTVYAADNVGAGLSWPDCDPAPGTPSLGHGPWLKTILKFP